MNDLLLQLLTGFLRERAELLFLCQGLCGFKKNHSSLEREPNSLGQNHIFFFFLRAAPAASGSSQAGVELELQLLATPQPQPHRILNPLSEVGD